MRSETMNRIMLAGIFLFLLFPVPGNADEVIITENENGITVEYTGTPDTAPAVSKKSEGKLESKDTAPAEDVPAASTEIDKKRQDRRLQMQLRQKSRVGQEDE